MPHDEYLRYLTSALIQVATGIIPTEKVLAWMRANPAPYDLTHTEATIKWWLEAEEQGKFSSAQLRHNLGFWLMGHLNYADAMDLEFIGPLRRR